ncbi:GFA family protein [Aidingimonas lacisalsi]|uniref:GFA family protein n=1 Tax=Aidingimonas lacisalsi TaxID=2604086 RepID=UPI00191C0E86|nr:GFA family protein [Aidingimonas lacisalsi]
MKFSGSCLCGSLKYECSGEVKMAGNCHCLNCKKATGSAYAAVLFVPEDSVEVTGEVKYYQSTGSNGEPGWRGFCPNCGSSLFEKPGPVPGTLGIGAGSLDDLSLYKPQMDIFTSRSPDWDCMDPRLPKFTEFPPEG